MNSLITFQSATLAADANGQPIETWANVTGYVNLFTSIITTGGKEFYAAQKINAETTMLFKIRYVSGITNTMRIVYNSRNLNILNINNVNEKNEFILISAKEVV
jgi:SPP1 family predicted phage head-tail adaptor